MPLRNEMNSTVKKEAITTLWTSDRAVPILSYDCIRFLRKLMAAAVQCELLWFTGIKITSFENKSNLQRRKMSSLWAEGYELGVHTFLVHLASLPLS